MKVLSYLSIFIGGLLFGIGLAMSNMTKPEVILSFLQLKDLGLLFVLGGAALVTMIAFYVLPKLLNKPVLGTQFHNYPTIPLKQTILGAILFGLGWGVSGICPGSALASLGIGNYPILIAIAFMFIGAYVQGITTKTE